MVFASRIHHLFKCRHPEELKYGRNAHLAPNWLSTSFPGAGGSLGVGVPERGMLALGQTGGMGPPTQNGSVCPAGPRRVCASSAGVGSRVCCRRWTVGPGALECRRPPAAAHGGPGPVRLLPGVPLPLPGPGVPGAHGLAEIPRAHAPARRAPHAAGRAPAAERALRPVVPEPAHGPAVPR